MLKTISKAMNEHNRETTPELFFQTSKLKIELSKHSEKKNLHHSIMELSKTLQKSNLSNSSLSITNLTFILNKQQRQLSDFITLEVQLVIFKSWRDNFTLVPKNNNSAIPFGPKCPNVV